MSDEANLPPPPVPADLDLSGLEYMPLLVMRLKRSKAWLRAKRKPELGFYMINLWTAAWMEKPAASLDDDDDVLADAAMCEPAKWPKIKQEVMKGFRKHSDGRLYHHVLVEEAMEALEKRVRWRNKKRRQRGKSEGNDDGPEGDGLRARDDVHPDVPRDVLGDDRRDTQGETPLRDGTGRDGTIPEGRVAGVAAHQESPINQGSVPLPREESPDLQRDLEVRNPGTATPGGLLADRSAVERQGAWFNAAGRELRLLVPDTEADRIIARALDGDPAAKAEMERVWRNRARRPGEAA